MTSRHVDEQNAEWAKCQHSLHGHPETCSQCLGAVARHIDIDDGRILVDGEDVRANDEPVSRQVESARRRGSKASGDALARAARAQGGKR